MKFKVMGVSAGRKDSNCDILLKEALLACQEQGAEITMINLKDYNLLDCTGCTACTMGMSMGKNTGCSLKDKDDKDKIRQVLLNQDAVIFAAPTYALMPSSLYLKFMHRNLAYESAFLTKIGAIEPRDRVGTLIAVGGKWKFVIAENGLERDRTTEEGRGVHCDEIADTQGGFFMNPQNHAVVAEKIQKYKAIQFPGV